MPHTAPAPHHHHHRWWRRKLRLLASLDVWLGVVIAVVALLGLITIFRTIAGSFAICIAGMPC
jgi:uncharacterized membrane protein